MGGPASRLNAFVDSNVLVRHLTGDPPDQARCSTEFLRSSKPRSSLTWHGGVVSVLGLSRVERLRVAELVRAVVGFPAMVVADDGLLLRTLELYEQYRTHFADPTWRRAPSCPGSGWSPRLTATSTACRPFGGSSRALDILERPSVSRTSPLNRWADRPGGGAHARARTLPKPISAQPKAENTPNGIRTRAAGVKGRCPRPLDDGGLRLQGSARRPLQTGEC